MKNKKELIIDKKSCPKCKSIFGEDSNICLECGYNSEISEAFFKSLKKMYSLLNESTYEVSAKNSQGMKTITTTAKEGDTIRVTDENQKYNPWAICTKSVGRKDKKKFERCVMDIKKQQKMDEDLIRLEEYITRLITDSDESPKMKKGDFKKFISKLK